MTADSIDARLHLPSPTMSVGSVTKEQPSETASPSLSGRRGVRDRVQSVNRKLTTRDGWVGDYNYSWYVLLGGSKDSYSPIAQAMHAQSSVHEDEATGSPLLLP